MIQSSRMDRSSFILLVYLINLSYAIDVVSLACFRDPRLPFCGETILQSTSSDDNQNRRRAPLREISDRYEDEDFGADLSSAADEERKETEASAARLRRAFAKKRKADRERQEKKYDAHIATVPPMDPIMLALFPALQKDLNPRRYCPRNLYSFQLTCLPGKKLRYDLQVFCQEFSDTCGLPNLSLYESRQSRDDDGRPHGYGQKQKNGNFGTGNSFAMGLGVIPGLELTGSQGTDIGDGTLPFLDQIGGMQVNSGTDIGAIGKRIRKGPPRALAALTRGMPTLGLAGVKNINEGDKQLTRSTLEAMGIPTSLNSLGRILGKVQGNDRKRNREFYEPGYGALDKNTIAFGKVDHDEWNVPAGLGDIEINRGSGIGFG